MSNPRSGPDEVRLLPQRTTQIQPTPRRTMKSLNRNLRTVAALAAVMAIPHLASATTKTWQTLSAAPATTNISANVATNLAVPLTFRNGSGASARYAGPALLDRKSTRLNSSHLGISYAV